uniref:Reverse transcriptase domain-containing protein n=1 Tax=Tanacetum cinerariifolium TaxID=118510 RepID=A0A699HLH7_TANCI|nr:hypothetical protein [Tanacetum cinerariifolium]
MRTRSSSNLPGESSPNLSSSNPKRRNHRRSKQPFILEESPIDTMADQRTMAELLRAPTEGYAEAIVAWDRYKDLLRACPHHGFTELHKLDAFYNSLNTADQDSLNSTAGGNLLERRTQDVLTIIENKSKVRNSRNKSIVSQVKSCDANSSSSSEIAKLTHAFNQQTSVVTTAMTTILKQFQATPPPASVTAIENIQGYVAAAEVNYNQGNSGYRPPGVANQIRPSVVPLSELEKINEINMKAMQTQINNVKNELRNEMKNSIQALMSNQTNELKNMMASFFQMNTVTTSGLGSLPSNTIANPKGELKAITTQSGIVLDGPSVHMPPPFINPEEDKRIEETLTDQDLAEYTIKVPPPLVQKSKPLSQRNFVKMLKALLSNKEKLLELANTPLNENCSAVILKKLHEKLRDPRKFLIPCGFSELKCKALADLGASINLMQLLVWKKLGLPELISIRMTLELANRAICTPAGIARDVFVLVGKFTFPADFVIVDYESHPRVPLILGRPFLQTARALIDVHGEEMILRDGDERLTLNMRHDTSSYSNQPQKESINMINIFNDSCEDFLKDLFATNHLSGNPTFSPYPNLTSPEVKDDIFDLEGGNFLIEKLINLDSTKDLPSPHNINPLSGSTTSSSPNHLLEEFADELALITFPLGNDDLSFDIESDLKEIEYFLNHDPIKDMDSIIKDSIDESNLADVTNNFVDTMPEMFIVESETEYVYDDPFDSKGEKIKESKLLIDELDLPRLSDFLPFPEYDSFLFEDFSEIDALPSTNNEDKDFDPPLYELPFHKEVPRSETLLSFSYESEEKVFKLEILTSKGVHSFILPKSFHQGPKAFKVTKIVKSPLEIFLALLEKTSASWMNSWILKTRARGFVLRSPDLHIPSFILGIQYPNLID